MRYVPISAARISFYGNTPQRECILEVLSLNGNPLLILHNTGYIEIYSYACIRKNARIIADYCKSLNRRYGVNINVNMIYRSKKYTLPIQIQEVYKEFFQADI